MQDGATSKFVNSLPNFFSKYWTTFVREKTKFISRPISRYLKPKYAITSSQSEITDAPVFLFFIFVLNVLYVHFVIWSDSPYELPSQI